MCITVARHLQPRYKCYRFGKNAVLAVVYVCGILDRRVTHFSQRVGEFLLIEDQRGIRMSGGDEK